VGHAPGYDYTTIGAALNAATSGDTVSVAPGTYRHYDSQYPETFPLMMKSGVILMREVPDTVPEINADYKEQVFRCLNTGPGTRIEGFLITGGNAHGNNAHGGGLFLEDSELTLAACEIRDCEADDYGGGVYCTASIVTMTGCRLLSNHAESGGGMQGTYFSTVSMTDCIVSGNQAFLGGGGGLAFEGNTSIRLQRCDVSNNTTEYSGGGLYLSSTGGTLANCVISGNSALLRGGGMYMNMTSLEIFESLVSGNESMMDGGGSFITNNSVTGIEACAVMQNTASRNGGGLFFQYSDVDCLFTQIAENSAGLSGGGVHNDTCAGTTAGCRIEGNHSVSGAGIEMTGQVEALVCCLLVANEAVEFGGAVTCRDGSPSLINCTLTGNIAWDGGGALFCVNASPVVTNCILWNNTISEVSQSGSSLNISYSDVQGGSPGTGNFDADPLFVSSSEGDYFLSQDASGQTEDSPCLNAGSGTALSISFTACEETFFMDQFSTRTDMQTDTGNVDVGYHYHPTRPACRRLGCTITMPSHDFGPGDTCSCDVTLCNPDPVKYEVMPVFVLLDIYGTYFFAPSFSEYDHYTYDVFYGRTAISVLPAFAWPLGTGDAQGLWFHACITNHAVTELVGELGSFQFGYHE